MPRTALLALAMPAVASAEGDSAGARAYTEEALGLRLRDHLRAVCLLNLGDILVEDGARISEVSNGSAAQGAGLTDGDVITKIDDTLITDADSLVATIRSYRPGDEVTVTYTRGGDEKTVTLKLDSDASATNS